MTKRTASRQVLSRFHSLVAGFGLIGLIGISGCGGAQPVEEGSNDEMVEPASTSTGSLSTTTGSCDDSVYGQFCAGHCFNFYNSATAGTMCASGSATSMGCAPQNCTTGQYGGSFCGAYYAIFRCN